MWEILHSAYWRVRHVGNTTYCILDGSPCGKYYIVHIGGFAMWEILHSAYWGVRHVGSTTYCILGGSPCRKYYIVVYYECTVR